MSHLILTNTKPSVTLRSLKRVFLIAHRGSNSPNHMYKHFLGYEKAWKRVANHWRSLGCNQDPNALRNSLKNHNPEGGIGRVTIFKSFQSML